MNSGVGENIPMILIIVIVVAIICLGFAMITNRNIGSGSWTPAWIRNRMAIAKLDRDAFTFWPSSEMLPFNGLIIPESEAPVSIKSDIYTMAIEMVWYNTRKLGDASSPYRHILHRGSGELKNQTASVPFFTQPSACGGSSFKGLPPKGLPAEMNPGIFADPILNDLYVFVTTSSNFKRTNEMIHIPDVPMDKPFHLAVVMQKKLVEVYIDCQLQVSKILQGEPIAVSKAWYGLSGKANLMAQIQNLKLWNRALSPQDMHSRCSTITFSTKRPVCPSMLEDKEQMEKEFVKNKDAKVEDLGYGQVCIP